MGLQEGRWDDSPCNLTLPSICKKLGTKTDGKTQHQDCKQVTTPSPTHLFSDFSSIADLFCSCCYFVQTGIFFFLKRLLCPFFPKFLTVALFKLFNCGSKYFSFFLTFDIFSSELLSVCPQPLTAL